MYFSSRKKRNLIMSSPDKGCRAAIPRMKRIVVKVGTSSLTYDNGKMNLRFMDHLVRQISDLKNRGFQVNFVGSGANKY